MKHCHICTNRSQNAGIEWKNAELLRRFVGDDYKILSPKYTGTCAKHQRKVAKAIKRAREMGIIPYTNLVER